MKTKKIMNFVCLLSFLLFSAGIFAQNVTGKVTDGANVPIFGANVIVKGTSTGAATDIDGNYTVKASNGDVLVFSYLGYTTQEITVSGSTVNVSLEENLNSLDQVVISSTRKPVRILQATTAVNRVGTTEIATLRPETATEAIQNTPGIAINESQGRKGGFNIRGFPGGNVYTTTLIDGLPSSGIANLSSGTQEFYSFDSGVESIEVVRGAAATLFGRASGAGAINIISKTGGTEHKGSVSFTKYNNVSNERHQFEDEVDFRTDWNINGPLSEKLRYNVSGYLLNDSGTKEQSWKDQGAQIRANVDYLISEESRIRFSATYLNTSFSNNTDTPYDLKNEKPGAGFLNSSTFTNDYGGLFGDLPLANSVGGALDPLLDQNGNQIVRNPADFREKNWGGNFGVDGTFALGNGFALNQKLRYQSFNWNDMNDIAFSNFYTADRSLFRFLGRSEQDNSTFFSETRFSKEIKGDKIVHNINGGVFISSAERDRLGTNLFYFASVSPRPELSVFGARLRPSATTSHREEKSTGIFLGDEMVINEKLSVNLAFRYDWFNADFSSDPGEIRSTGTDFDPEPDDIVNINEKFEDYSFSLGANYLIGESSAIYANFLRAFSLPGVTTRTFIRPEDNEIINNFELGARAGLGELTLDATLFNTRIDNRVALFLNSDTQEFESSAAGVNKILGGEIAVTYAPRALKGLVVRGNLTLQQSEYDEFVIPLSTNSDGETNVDTNGNLFGLTLTDNNRAIDVAGNQVENTPTAIYNFSVGYNSDRWGADFGGYTYAGRFADATNLYETPNLSAYNLGAYITFPLDNNEIKVSMRVKNIFDNNAPQSLFATTRDDRALRDRQANPELQDDLFAWAVLQNPKRVLFTVAYNF